MSLESKQREGAEEALWSAVRRLQERLLLTHDQLVLAEAARSPLVEELRARTIRLEAAIEATRQFAITPENTYAEDAP
jgi:two-component system chemotaxis response regulator CheB